MGPSDLLGWAKFALPHWHKWEAPASASALIIVVSLLTSAGNPSLAGLFTALAACNIVWLLWFVTVRIQRTRKGRKGIALCIHAASAAQEEELQRFTDNLRGHLKRGRPSLKLDVFALPPRVTKKAHADDEAIAKLGEQCDVSLLLFGSISEQTDNKSKVLLFKIRGLVRARSPYHQNHANLAREFGELLTPIRIPKEDDFLQFEIRSESLAAVSIYITGITAAIAGEVDLADLLYHELLERSVNWPRLPELEKIRLRLPRRITETALARADGAFNEWIASGQEQAKVRVGESLSTIPEQHQSEYRVLLLRAASLFLNERRIREAKAVLRVAESVATDQAWRFSVAFLSAYEGKEHVVIAEYNKAKTASSSFIQQIEMFVERTLEEEPNKYGLVFLLGMLHYKLSKQPNKAQENLTKYLEGPASNKRARESAEQALRNMNSTERSKRSQPPQG